MLRGRIQDHGGSQIGFARAVLKISPAYLSDILAGKREPTDRVCEALGLTRLTVYTRKED